MKSNGRIFGCLVISESGVRRSHASDDEIRGLVRLVADAHACIIRKGTVSGDGIGLHFTWKKIGGWSIVNLEDAHTRNGNIVMTIWFWFVLDFVGKTRPGEVAVAASNGAGLCERAANSGFGWIVVEPVGFVEGSSGNDARKSSMKGNSLSLSVG